MKIGRIIGQAFAVGVLTLNYGAASHAQTYPDQLITIVGLYPAGTSIDVGTRLMTNVMGWKTIHETRPGAYGTIGSQYVARAKPDGYTLLEADITSHAISTHMVPGLPYDPIKDFTPITLLWEFPSAMAVPANHPANSLKELLEYGTKQSKGLTYGSQGPGSGGHILGALLQKASGNSMTHVPYRGPQAALQELVNGQIDFLFSSYGSLKPFVESGKIKLLGITSKQRLATAPDLQTMTQLGYPSVFFDVWFGIVGPAGLPEPIVRTIRDKISVALATPEMQKFAADQNWTLRTTTSDEFRELIRTETARLSAVLKESGAAEQK